MLALLLALAADTTTRPITVAVAPAETLAVQESGAGDPVVLIPGLLGSAYEYRRVVPLLAQAGYRAIVIEPLGVGQSGRPRNADYSLTAQASRIAAVLDSLAAPDAIVVAHAVASSIALRLALLRPDLVQAIVSLEGGAAESATTPGFRRAMKLAPVLKMLGVDAIRGMIHKELIDASGDPSWVTGDVVLAYTEGAARDVGATLDAYKAMGRSTEPAPLAEQLSRVRCPVVLLLGAARHASGPPPREVELLERRLPAFTADTLADVGHFPQEEAPSRVAAAVTRVRSTLTLGRAEPRP
jgi:pimeloyl-ACP methyl ester carboxylesterase